ncbi:MAG TPA: DUF3800 domain-containing protein [Ignavibacteria bacterium]|nr:DUF3800 domain-containing protein [Ignavibacteria bacterium]
MYFCYLDESGTSDIPGNSQHFILAGLAIPNHFWKNCEKEINFIKKKYLLESAEIHTGWLLRKYSEQNRIPDFDKMTYIQRKVEVQNIRNAELLRLQRTHRTKNQYRQTRKNYKQTASYIHLTFDERKSFVKEVVVKVGSWGFARLFAECIDKTFFNPTIAPSTIDEQAFEQVVSRFEQFLNNSGGEHLGILIHDNNETVARKHTELMKQFYSKGTLWTNIEKIIETPLFVNSELTSMIQIADVCAYSIRRYLENDETELFDEIYKRADRKKNGVVVGIRHFSNSSCKCQICASHKTPTTKV